MSTSIERRAPAGDSTYRRTTPTLIGIIGRWIWRALSHEGQQRAQRRTAAAQREAAKEVIAVRALAHSHRNSDPGFSSDLYAAADRFERERPDLV